MNLKVVRSNGTEQVVEDIYVLHITHRNEGPLSIDYIPRNDNIRYEKHKSTELSKIVIDFNK